MLVTKLPNKKTIASLRAVLEDLKESPRTDINDGACWIAEIIGLSEQVCASCGHDRDWHVAHRPRHTFRPRKP